MMLSDVIVNLLNRVAEKCINAAAAINKPYEPTEEVRYNFVTPKSPFDIDKCIARALIQRTPDGTQICLDKKEMKWFKAQWAALAREFPALFDNWIETSKKEAEEGEVLAKKDEEELRGKPWANDPMYHTFRYKMSNHKNFMEKVAEAKAVLGRLCFDRKEQKFYFSENASPPDEAMRNLRFSLLWKEEK